MKFSQDVPGFSDAVRASGRPVISSPEEKEPRASSSVLSTILDRYAQLPSP
jgi:hypothetical protein